MNLLKLKKQFINNFGVNALVSAFIGVIMGVCLLLLTPGKTIALWKFGTYVIVSIFVIWFLILSLLSRTHSDGVLNLEVIKFRSTKKNDIKCLLNACDYLTYGAYITLFESCDGIEEYIATGIVENIQSNGIITVKLITKIDSNEYSRLLNNSVDTISSIRAKPIVTEDFLNIGGMEVV